MTAPDNSKDGENPIDDLMDKLLNGDPKAGRGAENPYYARRGIQHSITNFLGTLIDNPNTSDTITIGEFLTDVLPGVLLEEKQKGLGMKAVAFAKALNDYATVKNVEQVKDISHAILHDEFHDAKFAGGFLEEVKECCDGFTDEARGQKFKGTATEIICHFRILSRSIPQQKGGLV